MSDIAKMKEENAILRERLELKLLEQNTAQLKHMVESFDLTGSICDPSDRWNDDGEQWDQLTNGRAGGLSGVAQGDTSNFFNEIELTSARNACRILAGENPFAICGHENRINYICGDGHTYTAVGKKDEELAPAAIESIQEVLDEFIKANRWGTRQQEIVRRMDRDGEVFLRFFVNPEGMMLIRFVEPVDVFRPDSQAYRDHAAFGIETDPMDVETVRGYWIDGELVDASEIQHRKANVDCNVRRGRPTFWPVRTNLRKACKILHNIAITSDIQTAIAMVRRHMNGTAAGLLSMQSTNADYRWTDPVTSQSRYAKRYPAGSIIDSRGDTEYDFPAAGIDVEKHVSGVQAQLRAAASRVVMAEFMFTSDASNANYSSTMVAESPAVRMFQRLQATMRDDDLEVIWAVLRLAAAAGRIDPSLLDRVEIQVGMPQLEVRDKYQEAQTNAILNDNRVLSPQTWAGKAGLDYAQEQENFKQHDKDNPPPEPKLPAGMSPFEQLTQAGAEARAAAWLKAGYPLG